MLFQAKERTRKEPLRRGERLFDFYDARAGNAYDTLRSIVNGWLAEMPDRDRGELISRMRNGGDREFEAALCEILVHAWLVRSGCKVVVHPEIAGTANRPDFAAVDENGSVLCYVEVTTVNPPAAQEAADNRENAIYSAIAKATLPAGCLLGYDLVKAGPDSPALRPLVAEIEQWARDNVEAARTTEVIKTFTRGDWEIRLELFAGQGGEGSSQGIGVAGVRGGVITPAGDVRKALDLKARHYGTLDAPYLIVVADAKDQMFGRDAVRSAITEAVFGDEVIDIDRNGKIRTRHADNGLWRGSNGARNRHVSGVLLLPDIGLWRLREESRQPLLAINPWPARSMPRQLKRLKRLEVERGRWAVRDGELVADRLGLPSPWPPETGGDGNEK
jgi:hypothetical protein